MAEGRFNQQGSAAFYTASGECCARTEVPASEDRLLFSVADRSIEVFDLAKFALDYGYGSSFVQAQHSPDAV